jgi:hypothetical protein
MGGNTFEHKGHEGHEGHDHGGGHMGRTDFGNRPVFLWR